MDGEPECLSENATESMSAPTFEPIDYQNKRETLEKKAIHLRLVLEKDFKAADLKWSLFVAAAFSFRYESCLRPFPPAYIRNGIKDMDELLSIIADVPALDLVLHQLNCLSNVTNISELLDLLFYVLVRLQEPALKTIPADSHEEIFELANLTLNALKPQYIFQVISPSKSTAEIKWRELSKSHKVFYAFYGNRLENFYTILHFGLQPQLSKGGSGFYLSPDLGTCLSYSNGGGFGWGASCIGGHLTCIAMCEVADAPAGINYKQQATSEGDGGFEDGPNYDKGQSIGDHGRDTRGAVYVVTDCDLVRVRYLLVYAKQPTARFPSTVTNWNTAAENTSGGLRRWFSRHKLVSILLGYGLMLATIGLANNQPLHYYYKLLLTKFEAAYSMGKV